MYPSAPEIVPDIKPSVRQTFKNCTVLNDVVNSGIINTGMDIVKDLTIGGIQVTAKLAKEFKEKTDKACKYRDIRITHDEIEKMCEEAFSKTGKGVFIVEKSRVPIEIKDEWIKNDGHKFIPNVTEEELETYRDDLTLNTCCFVKQIDVSDFCKFSLPIKLI